MSDIILTDLNEKRPVILHEKSGESEEVTKKFSSERALLKIIKQSALPSKAYYDLVKTRKAQFEYGGVQRSLWIEDEMQ